MKKLNYKLFMLCTTAVISAGNLKAENCMPTDCAAMGFTQTKDDCSGYNSLLCPYDLSKYFCSSDVCDSMFQYACTGTGYDGGVGYACNGKYSRCSCSTGYEWSGTVCEKCDSSYNLVCNETGYKGVTPSCGGYYKSCTCDDGFCIDSNGKCTQDACKMDYKLQVNFSMPWGSCVGGFNTTSWTIGASIYDLSGKFVASASLMLTGSTIVRGGSKSVDFNNKVPEGEYRVYLSSSFSQTVYCSQFVASSIFIGGNDFSSGVYSDGVVVGLYKRNTRAVVVNGNFGAI